MMKYALACVALTLAACQGRPEYSGGTLVVTAPVLEETEIAAVWWNAHGGDWTVNYGACYREPCVVVMLGDCRSEDKDACAIWDGGDAQWIALRPEILDRRDEFDLPLLLAHEIGHVMGYDHGAPGTVMAANNWEGGWAP